MKLVVALVIALMATISVGMALDAKAPAWLEKMGPGESYTYGDYSTKRAVVGEDTFDPQTLNSKLIFTADGVSANVDQTVATSILGTPEGINRQLLEQSAAAFVYEKDGLTIDSENDDSATTLVMNIVKDQSALFSGKIVSDISTTLGEGPDAPFDGTGANDMIGPNGQKGYDDYYTGRHNLRWLDLTGNDASFTATFNDQGSLTATDANEKSVTLRQSVVDAKVTVSAEARDPNMPAIGNVVELMPPCTGAGELWTLNPDGSTSYLRDGHLVPSDYEGSAQLTEAAASISSDVTLTDKEVMILGNICNFRTLDGSAGLEGAFANAITAEGSTMNIDLDGDMDFWWE